NKLNYRYTQFENYIQHRNPVRMKENEKDIEYVLTRNYIVSNYKQIVSSKESKMRVTHHDTKISNVLFDKHGQGICVIDLDTVMPGYFISDVGDMMRTYM